MPLLIGKGAEAWLQELRTSADCALSPFPEGWHSRVEPRGRLTLEVAIEPVFVAPRPPQPLWQLHAPDHSRCAVAWSGIRLEPVTVYVVAVGEDVVALSASSPDAAYEIAARELSRR